MSVRVIAYNGAEHKARVANAKRVHRSEGQTTIYGDGRVVLREGMSKAGQRYAHVIGENGRNEWNREFAYTDYFLA